MDQKQISDDINKLTDALQTAKNNRAKAYARMTITYGGGLFRVTPELISFINSLDDTEVIIEDEYESPVRVERLDFLNVLRTRYREVMLEWEANYHGSK